MIHSVLSWPGWRVTFLHPASVQARLVPEANHPESFLVIQELANEVTSHWKTTPDVSRCDSEDGHYCFFCCCFHFLVWFQSRNIRLTERVGNVMLTRLRRRKGPNAIKLEETIYTSGYFLLSKRS